MPGDHPEKDRGVPDCSGHGPDMIEAGRERCDAVPTDEPEGRFEPHGPAEGGRRANGPASVGTQRTQAHAGGQRHCRTAAGSAGYPTRVPRVARPTIVRIVVGGAVCKLVQVQLTHQDGPRLAQLANHRGIGVWNPVGEDPAGGGRPNAAGRKDVLEGDRDPRSPRSSPERRSSSSASRSTSARGRTVMNAFSVGSSRSIASSDASANSTHECRPSRMLARAASIVVSIGSITRHLVPEASTVRL